MQDQTELSDVARAFVQVKETEEARIWDEIRATPQWQRLEALRRLINTIYESEGLAPRYSDVGVSAAGAAVSAPPTAQQIRYEAGAFVGTGKQEAVTRYLSDRFRAAGNRPSPATVDDIYAALIAGNFAFGGQSAETAKHGLKTSMGKRPEFLRLDRADGNDLWSLKAWYPGVKSKRPRRAAGDTTGGGEDESESPDTGEENPDAPE